MQQRKSKEDIARDFFEHTRPSSLIKRFETTDEIASMVTFLCSESASAVTGSAVRVDGGVVKSIA
jgi:enoyl-[acyl-carrier-protein] reductase (NADH)